MVLALCCCCYVHTVVTSYQFCCSVCNETFFILLLSDCQTVLVELLVAMVSQRITAEELALLVRLFLEKTPPTVNRAATHRFCPVPLC